MLHTMGLEVRAAPEERRYMPCHTHIVQEGQGGNA